MTREIVENESYEQNQSINSTNINNDNYENDHQITQNISKPAALSPSRTQSNSNALITTILNRQIELAKEVEEENLESLTPLDAIENNFKQGLDKFNNTATQPSINPTAGDRMNNIPKYQASDVYIV